MEPDKKINPKIEKIRRELHRKSLDSIIVKNPTNEDITVIWDKFRHVVPANSERSFPRYIAMKYIREVTDKLIYQKEEDHVAEQNKKRLKRGNPPLTAQEREQQALQYGIHLRNEELRKEIFNTLYGGISEEYGVDLPPTDQDKPKKDIRTFEEKMLDEMEAQEPVKKEIPVITEQDTKNAKAELKKRATKNGEKD